MENPTENGIYPCVVLTDQGPEAHCCMWMKGLGVWYWWIDDGLSGGWESVTDYNCAVVAWELPMQHSDTCAKAVSDVVKERKRQDIKWGGPTHDDEHGPEDWERFIMKRIPLESESDEAFRVRMVQIAALAIAAIESFDRKNSQKPKPKRGRSGR